MTINDGKVAIDCNADATDTRGELVATVVMSADHTKDISILVELHADVKVGDRLYKHPAKGTYSQLRDELDAGKRILEQQIRINEHLCQEYEKALARIDHLEKVERQLEQSGMPSK